MKGKFKAACIQLNTQNNLQKNVTKAIKLIQKAARQGVKVAALPENAFFMGASPEELLDNSFEHKNNPVLKQIQQTAKEADINVILGSLSVKCPDSKKLLNRCYFIDNRGEISAHYDKIHLYDASVKNGESHQESKRYNPGNKARVVKSKFGKIGLSICYDLRFPYLYRDLAQKGAQILSIPAAFTKYTGEFHWHVLLRARAIENACYVIAPAQVGEHPANRSTYGYSLIIDPWGDIIAQKAKGEGIVAANIDLRQVEHIRKQIPSIKNDREYTF